MRLRVLAAAAVAAFPVAPALAHCRTVHHRVAWHAPVRRHLVRYASCGCRRHFAYRPAVYPVIYRRPPIVEVTYERPLPLYRPYPIVYPVPLYRPHPFFYAARFGGPRFHRWGGGFAFGHRGGGWGHGGWGHGGWGHGGWGHGGWGHRR